LLPFYLEFKFLLPALLNDEASEVVPCCEQINVELLTALDLQLLPQFIHFEGATLFVPHRNRLAGVDIDGVGLVYAFESLLQLCHKLNLRVQTAHAANRLLKVYGVRVFCGHKHFQVTLDTFETHLLQGDRATTITLHSFLVKLREVNFVAKLLDHIVEHDFFHLIIHRDLQQGKESAPQSIIFQ